MSVGALLYDFFLFCIVRFVSINVRTIVILISIYKRSLHSRTDRYLARSCGHTEIRPWKYCVNTGMIRTYVHHVDLTQTAVSFSGHTTQFPSSSSRKRSRPKLQLLDCTSRQLLQTARTDSCTWVYYYGGLPGSDPARTCIPVGNTFIS